jgi:hypothetical protein
MKYLYFDESGFTGNNLLDEMQPFFVYLGIDSNIEIENKFIELKQKYNYLKIEIKGNKISKSHNGQLLLNDLWDFVWDRVKYVVHDKKYALAAKIFEYVYEPIFPNCNMIFYSIDFHRFFSSLIYSLFIIEDKTAESFFNGFCEYIKNKKQNEFLPLITNIPDQQHPLDTFYRFCELHRKKIACDIDFSTPMENWLLDLTMTSLYSLLGAFAGDTSEELLVTCDESKPMREDAGLINTFIGDTRILYTNLLNNKTRINYNLKEPIKLCNSKNYLSLQIADILVSSISYSISHKEEEFSKKLLEKTNLCFLHKNSVLPLNIFNQYDEYEIMIYFEIMNELCKRKSKTRIIEKIKKLGYAIHLYQSLYR